MSSSSRKSAEFCITIESRGSHFCARSHFQRFLAALLDLKSKL